MQTFLPYPDFAESARVLDNRRLGKQRVETLQILNVMAKLRDPSATRIGWANHPAVRMWIEHPTALALYGVTVCDEWKGRGFKDTCLEKIVAVWATITGNEPRQELLNDLAEMPPWLVDERFYSSHRSSLLRKDLAFYSRYGWTEPDDIETFWPTP